MADTSIECLGARGRLYLGLGETRMVVTPTLSSQARLDPLAAEQLPAETTLSISTSGREYAFRHTIAAFITVEETAPHRELAKTIRKKALQYAIELSPGYNEISNPELGELELTLQPGHHEIPLNRCMPHSEASGIYIYCHR